MKETIFILILTLLYISCSKEIHPDCNDNFGQIIYPVFAHSHNDYEQEIPITNAINHGFTSIEVDIAFDGTQLRVSHDDKKLATKPIFEDLYLTPIINNEIANKNLMLLVDIKNYSSDLIEELNTILDKYENKLVTRENPALIFGRLKIVLSGELPRQELINNSENRFLFIDGRLNDTDLNSPADIVPIISLNISDISDSNASNQEVLINVIKQVHDKNKMIRFWNTNDKESVWLTLIELNADIIGVDNIEKFCGVMKKNDLIN